MDNNKQQTFLFRKYFTEIFKYEVKNGVSEFHVIIHATNPKISYEEQLKCLIDTYYRLREKELYEATAVFKRYFLSDASNQADTLLALMAENTDCALSIVEQPPLNGQKIALWFISKPMYRRGYFTMVCLKLSIILIVISGEVMLSIVLPIQNTRLACY